MISVVGVDPSLTCTGWAHLYQSDDGRVDLAQWGTIRHKSSLCETIRGYRTAAEIGDVCGGGVDLLGIEAQHATPGRGDSALKVAAVRGAVTAMAQHYGVEHCILVQPSTAKKELAGSGRASRPSSERERSARPAVPSRRVLARKVHEASGVDGAGLPREGSRSVSVPGR